MSDLIKSPVGEIQFMALNNKVKKNVSEDSPEGYTIRLKFDGTTNEGATFRETVEKINANLVGTKHVNKEGEYTVRAFTKFDVEVFDSEGNTLEERPNFFKDSTGTASMIIKPYTGNSMGGTINLVAVVINELDTSESSADQSTLLDQIKDMIGK